jgi:hypothetical protein
MNGCAFGPCGRFDATSADVGLVHGSLIPKAAQTDLRRDRFHCYLCYVMPLRFPPVEACASIMGDGKECRLIRGHRGNCRAADGSASKEEANATRDGDPKLAAERKRPLSRQSNRAGPNYVPHNRRV